MYEDIKMNKAELKKAIDKKYWSIYNEKYLKQYLKEFTIVLILWIVLFTKFFTLGIANLEMFHNRTLGIVLIGIAVIVTLISLGLQGIILVRQIEISKKLKTDIEAEIIKELQKR